MSDYTNNNHDKNCSRKKTLDMVLIFFLQKRDLSKRYVGTFEPERPVKILETLKMYNFFSFVQTLTNKMFYSFQNHK